MKDTHRIDLLRHGEPLGGTRYRGGRVDDPLSETGWRQMWATVGEEAGRWQRIVSSPMLRCVEFARALGERDDRPVEVDERLREVGFGAWEGRTGAELRADDPDQIRRFYANPLHNRPAGAEPLGEFIARTAAAVEALLAGPPGHTLVVCHAGIIRAAVVHLTGIPHERMYRLNVSYASLTRISAGGERPPRVDCFSCGQA
ncbi:MAG: histidine phosphatase family protein [Chromatiales bacterium]|nr:histidine phosphatase family protein [Chromatiales bacterium]